MNRTEKAENVESLHQAFQGTQLIVVTHYSGMTVGELTDLRRKMRDAGASLKVTKNRLARRALVGTNFEKMDGLFTGPTAIAYSQDPVAAAKVASDYARGNDKFAIVGGGLGAQVLNKEGVEALAKLPSLDQLRAGLLSLINTPATRIAGVLQAPGGQVARVRKAYADKDQAAA